MHARPFLVTLLLLGACVPQAHVAWYNPEPQEHDFDKERYACLQDSAAAAPSEAANSTDMFGDPYSYDINADNRENLFKACMKTKGWELQQVPMKISSAAMKD
jgi:hypothetical protein